MSDHDPKVLVPNRRLLYSVEEAAQLLGIGRTFMFELVAAGQVASLKIGRRRKIPSAALDDYVRRLAADQTAISGNQDSPKDESLR
jgi:excisionase family DNA binding protein